MAERVHQRLAADPVDVVADHRVQGARGAFADHAEHGLVLDAELLADAGEGFLEVAGAALRRAQPPDRVAAFVDDP